MIPFKISLKNVRPERYFSISIDCGKKLTVYTGSAHIHARCLTTFGQSFQSRHR